MWQPQSVLMNSCSGDFGLATNFRGVGAAVDTGGDVRVSAGVGEEDGQELTHGVGTTL